MCLLAELSQEFKQPIYNGLQEVIWGLKRLQDDTRVYRRLQEVTKGYRTLHGVTRCYRGLQRAKIGYRGYKGLQKFL